MHAAPANRYHFNHFIEALTHTILTASAYYHFGILVSFQIDSKRVKPNNGKQGNSNRLIRLEELLFLLSFWR